MINSNSRLPTALALTLAAIILSALRPPAAAQDARPGEQELGKPLQYEVSVVLKLIQVTVVDRKGQPVGDLEQDDFLVYDNGRPVEITAFERHAIHAAPESPEDRPAVPAAPTGAAEDAPALDRKIFILFDFAFNNPRGIGKAKEAALSFLDTKVRPEDEVAVLTYTMVKGVRVQEYLTRDHAKVREIVDSIDRRAAAGRASEIEERFWREATEGAALPRESAASGGSRSGSEYNWERQEAKRIAQVFILRLTDLAKALRYVQGRKDFLFFSSGVPSSMIYGAQAGSVAAGNSRMRFDAGDNVLRDQNEALLKEFATADCAFYAFDTREAAKVASLFTYDEETFASGQHRDLFSGAGVFGDQTSVFKDEQFTGRNSLQRLSQTTGGKYFGNIDSYDRSLDQVQDLTGTYYVLGFSVSEKEDGTFHDVRVEVKTKGLEVRGASGYYNPKPFKEFNELERKLHLFDLAMNERAFSRLPERFPMAVLPVSLSDRSGLIVLGRVPQDLASKLAGGPLEFISLVLDEQDNIHDMRRIEASAAGPRAFLFRAATEAGPGRYRCRVVIRNTATGLAAVSSVAGTAIEDRSGNLRVQPPLVFADRREPLLRLTASGGRSAGLLERTGPYPLDAEDIVPVLAGIGPDRELTVVVPCEVLEGGADLKVNARLVGSAGGETVEVPFFLRSRERLGPVQVVRLGIPSGSLGPGSYNLYIFLQDPISGETAYSRLILTVSPD